MKNFEEIKKYEDLNNISKKGGAVFFGGSYLSTIPICELVRDWGLDMPVHNRSIKGLTIDEAQNALNTCIFSLKPQKVFLNIGDCDILNKTKTDDFIAKYEWLLYTLHINCKCRIYVLSVVSTSPRTNEINSRLKQLCETHKCEFIDMNELNEPRKFFDKIRFYMRSYPITFSEAMSV